MIKFYFDIVCPYSYLGFHKILLLCQNKKIQPSSNFELVPVLLGGIYKSIRSPQGKDGSATDIMPPSKVLLLGKDLTRQFFRFSLSKKKPSQHPQRTLLAQRVLIFIQQKYPNLMWQMTQAFYEGYWQYDQNMESLETLMKILRVFIPHIQQSEINIGEEVSQKLIQHTEEIVSLGGVGVPSYYVPSTQKLYWGQDRFHFVMNDYFQEKKFLFSPLPSPSQKPPPAVVEFFFDYASPWAFIGYAASILSTLKTKYQATIIFRPILLGALFSAIGTPNLPMSVQSDAMIKRNNQDMKDWCTWWGDIQLRWPDTFPIRTPDPLRVTLLDEALIPTLFKAAWLQNTNIGDPATLKNILTDFYRSPEKAEKIIQQAKTDSVKQKLRDQTEYAQKLGICGVPTFRVNDGDLIWGQDRWPVLVDIVEGRIPSELPTQSLL